MAKGRRAAAKFLSGRAYAEHAGVSQSTVRRWIQRGKIVTEKSGKIDPVKADAMLEGNLGRLPNHGPKAEKINGNGDKKVNGKRVSLTEAQTKKVNAEAQLAELKVAEQQRHLVQKDSVQDYVFKLFRDERDALVAWPGRIGQEIALDLQQKGTKARTVTSLLEKYVKRYLAERIQAQSLL